MTVDVSPVFLLDAVSQSAVEAELWDAITEKQLEDWEAEWLPELFKFIRKMHRAGIKRQHWPQSRHWNWRAKTESLQGMLAQPGFAVVCDGMTQGMMLADTITKRCKILEQKGKDLVYVDYVENAPWNRSELTNNDPKYRGVGSILIRSAIELSKELGYKGRIGLHSLPQANGFYANTCGMSDLGIDSDYQDLRYFEMTSALAEAFIAKGN